MKTRNKIMLVLALAGMMFATFGCQSPPNPVPATKFKVNPKTGDFTLDSPKNVGAESIDLVHKSGTNSMELHIKGWQSQNDAEVIGKSYTGQAESIRAMGELEEKRMERMERLFDKAAGTAAKVVKPVP